MTEAMLTPIGVDMTGYVQDTALSHAEQLFAQGDTNGDGVLNCQEVIALMLKVILLSRLRTYAQSCCCCMITPSWAQERASDM